MLKSKSGFEVVTQLADTRKQSSHFLSIVLSTRTLHHCHPCGRYTRRSTCNALLSDPWCATPIWEVYDTDEGRGGPSVTGLRAAGVAGEFDHAGTQRWRRRLPLRCCSLIALTSSSRLFLGVLGRIILNSSTWTDYWLMVKYSCPTSPSRRNCDPLAEISDSRIQLWRTAEIPRWSTMVIDHLTSRLAGVHQFQLDLT